MTVSVGPIRSSYYFERLGYRLVVHTQRGTLRVVPGTAATFLLIPIGLAIKRG